jgi:ABC-type uncharacterized transport system substrate-binding protein
VTRRALLRAIPLAWLGIPRPVGGQARGTVARVGFLSDDGGRSAEEGLRQGLRELGYVEGRDIVIEYRDAEERPDRLPGLVSELLRTPVDVLLTIGGTATRLAKEATATVPIVASSGVLTELVMSPTRPGGNVTGITLPQGPAGMGKKWLEILKAAAPAVSNVGVLYAPSRMTPVDWEAYTAIAEALDLRIRRFSAARPEELDGVFGAMRRAGVDAVIMWPGGVTVSHRARAAQLALTHGLPAIHEQRSFVTAGGLVAYGVDIVEVGRRLAYYVDRVLKGARPGDLPIEQPTKFDLAINLKTAGALGVTVPPSLLQRADEIIK